MPDFVSRSFTERRSIQSNLSIQAGLNGFCFYISDVRTGDCYALKKYDYTVIDYDDLDQKIRIIFEKEDFLKLRYERCFCMFLSDKSTLIPSSLFDPEHLRTILDFVVTRDELDEIHFQPITAIDAMNVFTIPSPLAALMHTYQNKVMFLHQSIPLIYLLMKLQPHNGIILHFACGQVTFVLQAEGRFVLNNIFHVKTATDTLYYLSYILKQWKLTPQNTTVYLSGSVAEEDVAILRRYYPTIKKLYNEKVSRLLGYTTGMETQLLQILPLCE